MIWKTRPTLEALNAVNKGTLTGYLGVEFTEVGEDYLVATMPVDHRTIQPNHLLHGGASVALAETLGSVASVFCLEDSSKQTVVGVEINANHLNATPEGDRVTGTVRPLKVGRKMQVWEIKIHRGDGKMVCVSRITIAVVERR